MSVSESVLVALFIIALVFSVLVALSLIIKIFSKIINSIVSKYTNTESEDETVQIKSTADILVKNDGGNFSAGMLKLINVDEPTAAIIMAIVSDESGIPLAELYFKSIKLIKE